MELLNKIKYIITLILILPCFANAQQGDLHIYDLKNNPFEVKNFSKRSYSKANDVIYFEQDASSSNTGRLIVNINTFAQNDITLSWTNATVNKVKTPWTAKLQYRFSETDEWKDVKDSKNNSIVYTTTFKRYSRTFSNISLPKECENQEFVQLSWLISTNGNKNNNPEILFRNISISSYYDKYSGEPAMVRVSMNGDENERDLNAIIFNNISIPYTYPETQRIKIEGEKIRDSITLKIVGENKECFSLSNYSVNEKQSINGKVLSVIYDPKKEGRHKAILEITTSKLTQTIRIPIEGSAANHKAYNKNMLPKESKKLSSYNYRIPVFSNTDYQYRFSLQENTTVYVKYRWYRNTTLVYSMRDTVRTNNYCVPLKAPKGANSIEIDLSSNSKFSMTDAYFGSPKVKTMLRSGSWSDDENWENGEGPVMEDVVVIDKGLSVIVDEDVSCSMLVLLDSANISIKNGHNFYVSSDIIYSKKSFFTVWQYLLPERWNYISSPVNQAYAAMFSMKNTSNDSWLMQYNTGKKSKFNDYWSEYITDPKFSLVPGRGYAVYTHDPLNVKYEGLLCSSSISIPLISTEDNKWNLVGNPYTAPLSSKRLFEDIDGKVQGNVLMMFDRENKVYNPIIIDPKEEVVIPSLESFFVEALPQPTEITFKRSHQYIPSTGDMSEINHNFLSLSVSRGLTSQYALLGMDDRAEYTFDEYDCHKMFGNNENMPDIYLTDGDDEYSVNVFPTYPAIYNIGMYIGNPSEVEMNLNNISVLPEGVMVFVEDLESGSFYDFCAEGSVTTFLKSGTTENYRIHIIKDTPIKEMKKYSGIYIWQDGDRTLFYCDMVNQVQQVRFTNVNDNTISEIPYTAYEVMQLDLDKGSYKMDLKVNDKLIKNIDIKIK